MAARIIDLRARNRALLARQLLLDRVRLSPLRAAERLVGLQAQTPRSPYTALWSRLRDFDPMALSRLIESRRAVRIALMRSTIHLASAHDALLLRPLMAPILLRELSVPTWRRLLGGVDVAAVAACARTLLEEQPRTPAQLGAALSRKFPGQDSRALAHVARSLLPLVQIPPRGLWDRSGATTLATAEQWLRQPLADSPSWDDVALRYLAAFGPATAADLVAWCRITRLAEVLDRLRPRLRVLHDADGRELFDVQRAPRPSGDVPAPPRFLPDYDNVLIGFADRSHVVADEHRAVLRSVNGVLPGTVLVDGFVAATWRVERDSGRARLLVHELRELSRGERADVREDGLGLLGLLASDASRYSVEFG